MRTISFLIAAALLTGVPVAHAANDKTKVTATWVAPVAGSVLTAPATIVLSVDAEAKQSSHPIVSVEFYNGATLLGRQTAPVSGLNYQLIWPNVTPGTYSLTATATNDKGDFDITDAVTITVIKASQGISGFSPATPITWTPNTSFMLTAMGGASGNPVLFGSTTPNVCIVSGSVATVQSAGTCTLTADQAGNTNYNPAPQVAATVVINTAPTVVLTAPANNSSFFAPASVALAAAASDADGSIAKVEFFQGATLIGTATTAPYTFTWNNVAEGTYVLTARATDNLGASTTSSVVTVKVNPAEAGIYYVHVDHLNTPRAITRPSDNAVVWKNDNTEPFGNSVPDENPSGLGQFTYNLRFAGQYFDQETGTNYNYFRDYDPSTGRYVESDPIGLVGGINTYSYVKGAPLAYADPLGLWVQLCIRWLKGIGVGGTNIFNPLTHHYLNISGDTIGFGPRSGGLFSAGQYETNEKPSTDNCIKVCDDPEFDHYVRDAIQEVGLPPYNLFFGDVFGTLGFNCQQWTRLVLAIAKHNYLQKKRCPTCFK